MMMFSIAAMEPGHLSPKSMQLKVEIDVSQDPLGNPKRKV
jgi:hypothetical protein